MSGHRRSAAATAVAAGSPRVTMITAASIACDEREPSLECARQGIWSSLPPAGAVCCTSESRRAPTTRARARAGSQRARGGQVSDPGVKSSRMS